MSQREENWDIYIINIDGSGLQRLTNDPANDGLPTWSPDGRSIAFVSDRGGAWAIWVMNADGTGQTALYGSNSLWPNSTFYARPIPGQQRVQLLLEIAVGSVQFAYVSHCQIPSRKRKGR